MNVEWIVNDFGVLGVKLPDGSCHFLHRGRSYQADPDTKDVWEAKKYRLVEEREFGDVCRVEGYDPEDENGKQVKYTKGAGWKPLPSLKVG